MAVSEGFKNYVLEQLGELGAVQSRRMFGGVGLYHEALFFALIDDDVLYFKVGDSTRDDYVARGMKAFCPFPDQPSMGYYQVPVDVLEEPADLAIWARKACDVALAARQSTPMRPKKRASSRKRAPKKAARKASGRVTKAGSGRKPSRR